MSHKTPRRFEFRKASSNHFWEVASFGVKLTTHWGEIGSDGQSQTEEHSHFERAEAEVARLIDEKLQEGYSEVVGPEPTADRPIDPYVAASVKASWERIDRWIAKNAPPLEAKMGQGASPSAIARAEAIMEVELPDDVRASYAIHDGSGRQTLFPSASYMSLAQVLRSHKMWNSLLEDGWFYEDESNPKGPIVATHYHPKWIPLTDNMGGDHTFIDLAPAEGGKVGQLINFSHEAGPEEVAASGLAEYLSQLADALERGAGPFNGNSIDWYHDETMTRSEFPLGPRQEMVKRAPKRYLQLDKGKTKKFWEITRKGAELTIRHGKVYSKSTSTTKTCAGPEEAIEEAAKLVAEKIAEGYAEMT